MQQTASLIVTRAPQSTQELFSRVAHWTLTIPWGCDPKEELVLGRGRCSHHVPRVDLRKGLSITPQTKEFACHFSTTSPISYGVLQVDSNPAGYSLSMRFGEGLMSARGLNKEQTPPQFQQLDLCLKHGTVRPEK